MPFLLTQVQARSPTLAAVLAAWRASAQRYPQAISLDDPMFMAMAAPASFTSDQVESAYALQGSQKVPWFGKRAARGSAAQAEATAAFQESRTTRNQLIQATQVSFFDLYLAARNIELNHENIVALQHFRTTARTRYENNVVTQQDVFQADLELAAAKRRGIELQRMQRTTVARLNTLLLRPADWALPPPPTRIPFRPRLPAAEVLRRLATDQRPELGTLAARVQAEQAQVTLAIKQYYPDAEFFGRYDTFWQPASTQGDLRGQLGINLNVPIYRGRLNAAVSEAQFRLSQRRAEYTQRRAEVEYEVQSVYEQVQEAQKTVQLYEEEFLPTIQQNVAAGIENYNVARITFLELILAQRQSISIREQYQDAVATYARRLADLELAIGSPLPIVGPDEPR